MFAFPCLKIKLGKTLRIKSKVCWLKKRQKNPHAKSKPKKNPQAKIKQEKLQIPAGKK
jgi:hypothetical protein